MILQLTEGWGLFGLSHQCGDNGDRCGKTREETVGFRAAGLIHMQEFHEVCPNIVGTLNFIAKWTNSPVIPWRLVNTVPISTYKSMSGAITCHMKLDSDLDPKSETFHWSDCPGKTPQTCHYLTSSLLLSVLSGWPTHSSCSSTRAVCRSAPRGQWTPDSRTLALDTKQPITR